MKRLAYNALQPALGIMRYGLAALLCICCGSTAGVQLGAVVTVENQTNAQVRVTLETVHSMCFFADAPPDCDPKRTKSEKKYVSAVAPRSRTTVPLQGTTNGLVVAWRAEPAAAVSTASGELKIYAGEQQIILKPRTAIVVYLTEDEVPQGCTSLGLVGHGEHFAKDSPEQDVPMSELKERTFQHCKERAAASGATAVLDKGIEIQDSVNGAFGHVCLAVAYKC